jgi:hypothetical protein
MRKFIVMSEHPGGDGSVQFAENHIRAFAKHVMSDYSDNSDITPEIIEKRIREDIDHGISQMKIEGNVVYLGDYEVKELF